MLKNFLVSCGHGLGLVLATDRTDALQEAQACFGHRASPTVINEATPETVAELGRPYARQTPQAA